MAVTTQVAGAVALSIVPEFVTEIEQLSPLTLYVVAPVPEPPIDIR